MQITKSTRQFSKYSAKQHRPDKERMLTYWEQRNSRLGLAWMLSIFHLVFCFVIFERMTEPFRYTNPRKSPLFPLIPIRCPVKNIHTALPKNTLIFIKTKTKQSIPHSSNPNLPPTATACCHR